MASNYSTNKEKIKQAKGQTFTIEQAREFERDMLKYPTLTNFYKWVDVRTKEPVGFSF